MNILDQIRIEETLGLLQEWEVNVFDGTTKSTLDWTVSVIRHISSNTHDKTIDSFIDTCNAAVTFHYEVFYLDKNTVFITQLVYDILKAVAFAFDLLPQNLINYTIQKKPVPLLISLAKEIRELRRKKNIGLRTRLQGEILREMEVDLITGLENQKQQCFENLCCLYFSKTQTQIAINYLRTNCLNLFIKNFTETEQVKKEWFLKMSEFILHKYMDCEDIRHQDLLRELGSYLKVSRKSSRKRMKSYADTLFTSGSIQNVFDDYELTIFFDNDLTLDRLKRNFDILMNERMLKRHLVSEFIFDRMKVCSHHTNCKFNCKFEICRYKTILELLGSHLPHYDIGRIEEKVGEEFHTDFLFVTNEDDSMLSLVLCCSDQFPLSSIYHFKVDRHQYMDALFLLFRYFESDYECKRKNIIKHMDRFGRYFGIVHTRVFRK